MGGRRRIGVIVPVPAGDVHVREDGPPDGRPVVLLHGFSGSVHWWDRVVPLLAVHYRLIRIDLLGHACTGGAAADAPEQARMVDAVLDKLGIVDATVVGHSFGADVAVELAETSGRVGAVVVVAQAPDYSDATLPTGAVLMTLPVIAPVLHRLAPVLLTVVGGVYGRLRGYPSGRELARQAALDNHALDVRMYRVVLRDRPKRMAARPLDEQVRASGKRALAVLGGRDGFYGARSAPRYAAAGAQVIVIERSGHSPNVDTPGELARILAAFVDG